MLNINVITKRESLCCDLYFIYYSY